MKTLFAAIVFAVFSFSAHADDSGIAAACKGFEPCTGKKDRLPFV